MSPVRIRILFVVLLSVAVAGGVAGIAAVWTSFPDWEARIGEIVRRSGFSELSSVGGTDGNKSSGGKSTGGETARGAAGVSVRTKVAETGDVETRRRFRGFVSVDPVNIVPRTRGRIESVDFKPGQIVERGDLLFRVESFDYRNAVESARAELAAALARRTRAETAHSRNLSLQRNKNVPGVVADETVEISRAELLSADAAVDKARSALDLAEKLLERTEIRSPVRGRVGRPLIPLGSFVDGTVGEPPTLTTVAPMNPARVYFYLTDRELIDFQRKKREEIKRLLGARYDERGYDDATLDEIVRKENLPDSVPIDVFAPGLDGEGLSRRGVVDYVDNKIDRSTGLVALRGEVPNPDYALYTGAVCEVSILDEPLKDATLIDAKAVCDDLDERFVWVVDDAGRAARRRVELGKSTPDGSQIAVLSGVAPGERYVVDGVLKLRSGAEVVEAAPARTLESSTRATQTANASESVETPKRR